MFTLENAGGGYFIAAPKYVLKMTSQKVIVAIEAGIGIPLAESRQTSGFSGLKFGILSCTNGFLVSDIFARGDIYGRCLLV